MWLSLLCAGLDQITKYLAVQNIPYGTMGIEIAPFFNLVHVYNFGAAFSFLSSMGGWQRWLFAAAALIISSAFAFALVKTPRSKRLTCAAMALFVGGAVGNLIDRLALGYVVDFLLFYIKGEDFFWAYPAFNVADICVCTGAFLLILSAFGRKS